MFNPNEHMMQLKGKDYLQVMWRLVWFRDEHPDWSIDANILEMDENHAIFKAIITDENGAQKSCGHGSESKRDFGDFLEKAETKAIGRALAMLGYGTQFAADELDEGERIVDTPVNRKSETKVETVPASEPLPQFNATDAIKTYIKRVGLTAKEFGNMRDALVAGGIVPDIKSDKLSVSEYSALILAIEKNYPDALGKKV